MHSLNDPDSCPCYRGSEIHTVICYLWIFNTSIGAGEMICAFVLTLFRCIEVVSKIVLVGVGTSDMI